MKRICLIIIGVFIIFVLSLVNSSGVEASSKTTMTRQGDTIWFGSYPQTKATDDELSKMSTTADENGYYTSGKDKFVMVSSANPQVHSETADTDYIPFDDKTQPVPGETYYFKVEPIEWKVLVDDEVNNAVKLVSRYYLDTHFWLSEENYDKQNYGNRYYNKAEGVPAETPANSWRYSEMRSWLNDGFYNTAFNSDEQKSIYLFENKNTIDYREDDQNTIVYDYVAVGNRSDYDTAGDDGRPTDYTIVKGASWCYNKDHIYYYVNATFSTFGSGFVRLYRHDEHEKVAAATSVEAVRPIIVVNRSDAKILATETEKEERTQTWMLILGIVFAVGGAILAVPVMISTSKKQKQVFKETGTNYRLNKKETLRITPGITLLVVGIVLVVLKIALFGGFGVKLQPGIYLQQDLNSGDGWVQVGAAAYRLNADGTFDYNASYTENASLWSGHGTWTQSGSTVTFVWQGNPMVKAGTTYRATITSSTSFNLNNDFKLISSS